MPVLLPKMLPPVVDCPHCGASMTLDAQERIEKKFNCPACKGAIDFTGHAEVQSSSSFKKEQPQEASTTSNESSHKDEETFCCSDCGGSITYGDLTCSQCGAVLEYEEIQDESPEQYFEKNDKITPPDQSRYHLFRRK
jgi:DNA-directed RNA polymerase subunit M/transcription elongation factor TFIIS